MPLTVIVSNRLPVSVKKVDGKLEFSPSDGGLATGLASYTKGRSSVWVGWPGIASDDLTESDKKKIKSELKKDNLIPVFLTQKQIDGFYSGYSNSVLWPLFHNLPLDIKDSAKYWKIYKQVNETFADAVGTASKPNSMIWVHDYQLLLLPELLRWSVDTSVTIGFFSHIPFPNFVTLKNLPQAKTILRGMLGASLVGFHTSAYGNEFMDCCNRLGIGTAERSQVILGSRTVRIADFPIGIDYEKFADAIKSKAVQKEVLKLQRKYRKYKIILTVDRLDPSKGFVERLEAYFEFLNINPQLHGKVKLVMLTIPSRTDVKAYKVLKQRIDQLVAMINDTYGTQRWQPIDFMYKSVPFEELSALYQVADVAFVAPIKDGMNLVAKEYIASKQKRDGVLILSETAGAAQELTDAVLVNPKKRQSLVAGLAQALNMTHVPISKRLKTMQKQLSSNTIHTWANGFMDTMENTVLPAPHYTLQLNSRRIAQFADAYQTAKKRVILLDYDGVLVPFYNNPDDAKPSKTMLKMLGKFAEDPKNSIAVASGRSAADLEGWLGSLNMGIIAEHGAFIKNGKEWNATIGASAGWKTQLLPILEAYADKTPGAFVEEKNHALVWHFRKSPPYQAQKYLTILKRVLKSELKHLGLKAYDGNKILEIKPPSLNKGVAVKGWLQKPADFVLIIGDDYTDEDMFKMSNKNAYTVKVGSGITAANYRLKDVPAVHQLLHALLGN